MKAFVRNLVVLASLSTIAATADTGDPHGTKPDCRVRAWVRAPDLEPGQVLQGDVKIKLDGACSDVSSYGIGLRFMERSWVKARREGVVLPEPPTANGSSPTSTSLNDSIFEPLKLGNAAFWSGSERGVEPSAWKAYQDGLRNPELWLAREEERIGFESRHILRKGPLGETNTADAEHIYAYFVDVTFANGTRHEVPAGYTSFRAVLPVEQTETETFRTIATPPSKCKKGHSCPDITEEDPAQGQYALEVIFSNGRHVVRGSSNNVTIIAHQMGPGNHHLLNLQSLDVRLQHNLSWAAMFAADNETAKSILNSGSFKTSQLLPVIEDGMVYHQFISEQLVNGIEAPQLFQARVVENATASSAEAINVSYRVTLQVQNVSSTNDEDDESAWTPKEEETEYLEARIPLFVRTHDGTSEAPAPTHYLSAGARRPVFVDPVSISELQRKGIADRDMLAPAAEARIITPVGDDIVKHRYYDATRLRGPTAAPPYYVGDVW
ncbi:hypothetical protein JB92DRAFT_271314 [Gautieria morchelliformis]|nr:hypothetical protein JB92DRAFT_271314 [Gautieria morchelliformis]